MVEAVLVVPILMVILLVVVQFALWAQAAQVVQLAASEGDRAAMFVGGRCRRPAPPRPSR